MRCRRSSTVTFLLGVLLSSLVWASPAAAHGELVAASPAFGETIGGAAHIDLIFSTTLTDWQMSVEGPDGNPIAGTAVQKAGPFLSFEATPPLSVEGQYIVRYSGSDTDGDLVEGAYAFSVEAGGPKPSPLPVDVSVFQERSELSLWFYVMLMGGVVVVAILGGLLAEKVRRLRMRV